MKGMMAEGMIYAKSHFWLCIKYMPNCHGSGALQGAIKIILQIIVLLDKKIAFI